MNKRQKKKLLNKRVKLFRAQIRENLFHPNPFFALIPQLKHFEIKIPLTEDFSNIVSDELKRIVSLKREELKIVLPHEFGQPVSEENRIYFSNPLDPHIYPLD